MVVQINESALRQGMTEEEAWELDELLTKTTPEAAPSIRGRLSSAVIHW
jgi:hypothetical protein